MKTKYKMIYGECLFHKECVNMDPQKPGTLCLLKILAEYSDKDHILGMKDIISLLGSEYGIETERRTVYRYINSLLYLGWDISVYDENGKGYYLRARVPDERDVSLITDCLRLYSPLSEIRLKRLEQRLNGTLSRPQRGTLETMRIVRDPLAHKYEDRTDTLKLLDSAAQSGNYVLISLCNAEKHTPPLIKRTI